MNTPNRCRGRPKKVRLSADEMLEELLFKAYNISVDGNGKLKFVRNDTPLTLEETSFLIWNTEGCKHKKPLSNMMIIKTERVALEKMRAGLAKYGITELDDVLGAKGRTFAQSKYGATDSPE